MMLYSIIGLLAMGTRILVSRFCCQTLGSTEYITRNFKGDFLCGVLLFLGLLVLSSHEVQSYYFQKLTASQIILNGAVALFGVSAEILLFKAIEQGVTGPAIAIVGFNSILVTFTSMILNGLSISIGQTLCIFMSFLGVIAIANGNNKK